MKKSPAQGSSSSVLKVTTWQVGLGMSGDDQSITQSGKMVHLHIFYFLFHQNELSTQPDLTILHMEGAAFPILLRSDSKPQPQPPNSLFHPLTLRK